MPSKNFRGTPVPQLNDRKADKPKKFRGIPVPQFLDDIKAQNVDFLREAVDYFRERLSRLPETQKQSEQSCINGDEAKGIVSILTFLGINLNALKVAKPEMALPLRQKIAHAEFMLLGLLSEGRTRCNLCIGCILQDMENAEDESLEETNEEKGGPSLVNTNFFA